MRQEIVTQPAGTAEARDRIIRELHAENERLKATLAAVGESRQPWPQIEDENDAVEAAVENFRANYHDPAPGLPECMRRPA